MLNEDGGILTPGGQICPTAAASLLRLNKCALPKVWGVAMLPLKVPKTTSLESSTPSKKTYGSLPSLADSHEKAWWIRKSGDLGLWDFEKSLDFFSAQPNL